MGLFYLVLSKDYFVFSSFFSTPALPLQPGFPAALEAQQAGLDALPLAAAAEVSFPAQDFPLFPLAHSFADFPLQQAAFASLSLLADADSIFTTGVAFFTAEASWAKIEVVAKPNTTKLNNKFFIS